MLAHCFWGRSGFLFLCLAGLGLARLVRGLGLLLVLRTMMTMRV
jgi:hypothetical protein